MFLRRFIGHVRSLHWTMIFIDFVIVVLGVFLGLQAQEWNQARQDHARARIYLQQLLIDLDGDIDTGKRGVNAANEVDREADIFIAALKGDPKTAAVSDADLVAAVPFAGYAYLPYANHATYDEMISTGGLGLLDNVKLKRALAEYYSWQSAGRQWDDLLRNEQYAYRAAIRGILTRKQYAWARRNAISRPADRTAPPDFDRDAFLKRARARPAILDSLRSMGAVQERLRNDSRALSRRAAALAERIRKELGRK